MRASLLPVALVACLLPACHRGPQGLQPASTDLEIAEVFDDPCAGCREVHMPGATDLPLYLHRVDTLKRDVFEGVSCPERGPYGNQVATLHFAASARARVERWTNARVGKHIAVVTGGTAWSVATVNAAISTAVPVNCDSAQHCAAMCAALTGSSPPNR